MYSNLSSDKSTFPQTQPQLALPQASSDVVDEGSDDGGADPVRPQGRTWELHILRPQEVGEAEGESIHERDRSQ